MGVLWSSSSKSAPAVGVDAAVDGKPVDAVPGVGVAAAVDGKPVDAGSAGLGSANILHADNNPNNLNSAAPADDATAEGGDDIANAATAGEGEKVDAPATDGAVGGQSGGRYTKNRKRSRKNIKKISKRSKRSNKSNKNRL